MINTKNNLQILSLNVDYGQMPRELTAYITSKADEVSVFCFQETDEKVRRLLDNILLADFEGFHALKLINGVDHGISIYVRSDVEVVDVTTVYSDVDKAGFAIRAKLIDRSGNRITVTDVYGVPHPGHKLDTPGRLGLSRKLVELAKSSGDAEVLAGDFNLLPEAESVKIFAANGLRDLISEFEIPTTRNEIAWSKYPADMKQLYADFAFIHGEGVDYDFRVEEARVSDHLPLVIDVSLAPQPTDDRIERLTSKAV